MLLGTRAGTAGPGAGPSSTSGRRGSIVALALLATPIRRCSIDAAKLHGRGAQTRTMPGMLGWQDMGR